MRRVLWALTLLMSLLATTASAQTPIWRQFWDNQSTIMSSSKTSTVDEELADDFDVVGQVEAVHVQGGYITYFNSPPMNLKGAYVRFYQWNNGVPGTLQYEQFISVNSMLVASDTVGNMGMQITLPSAFNATGKHFISVQAVADMTWSWHSANSIQPAMSKVMKRNRLGGGSWALAAQSDTAFQLYGVTTGPPRLDSLSSTTLSRSGRLKIFGSNFGDIRGNGKVFIGGIEAIVTRWTSTTITAYVPESAPLGSNQVQVLTDNGTSLPGTLNVTLRTSPGGRAKWRFQVDGYSSGDVIVGPDGTIYTTNGVNQLYALTPDGGLKWMTYASVYGSRLTQGPDGTLYMMADGRMTAVRPDGSVKWIFAPPELNFTISGPTVGPDGNIYAVDQHSLGFFSVTPEGQLRWKNPKVGDRTPRNHHVVFSNGQAYINHTHLDFPALELMAFDMASGQLRWIRDADRGSQPLIGPGGRIYVEDLMGVWYSVIYNPDGSTFLRRDGSIGQRTMSPDRTKLYTQGFQSTAFSALNSLNLSPIWTYTDSALVLSAPTADPLDRILLAKSQPNYGTPMSLLALTTGGQFLWRDELPAENGGFIHLTSGPAFSLHANTAYFGTVIPVYSTTDEYCYLYAFALDFTTTAQLTSLELNPARVNAGNSSTGTVRLTAPAPQGGAVVTLKADNAVAKVPASVTVPAGSTSANFTITTTSVQFSQGAMIHATYNGVVKSANLLIDQVPVGDTVRITKAEFSRSRLTVEASSTIRSSTLRVYNTATNALIGTLTNRNGRYSGTFNMATAPASITVRSSNGGSDTRTVTVR